MSDQEQVSESGKVEKKFNSNLSKLVSLMRQPIEQAAKVKVPNTEMASIVEELLKERKEETIKLFKTRASALLDKNVEFNKFVKQQKETLEKAILEKKKEFSKQMEECFALVENIDKLYEDYKASLEEAQAE